MKKEKNTIELEDLLLEILKEEGTVASVENKLNKDRPGYTLNDIVKDFGYRVIFEFIELEKIASALSDVGFDRNYIVLGLTNMQTMVEKKTEMTKKAYSMDKLLKNKEEKEKK
jgi:hypothetical protein